MPPTLIFLLEISVSRLISLGDLKYTTLSFKTFKTVKVVIAINAKNTKMNKNLNLTFRFLQYIGYMDLIHLKRMVVEVL